MVFLVQVCYFVNKSRLDCYYKQKGNAEFTTQINYCTPDNIHWQHNDVLVYRKYNFARTLTCARWPPVTKCQCILKCFVVVVTVISAVPNDYDPVLFHVYTAILLMTVYTSFAFRAKLDGDFSVIFNHPFARRDSCSCLLRLLSRRRSDAYVYESKRCRQASYNFPRL